MKERLSEEGVGAVSDLYHSEGKTHIQHAALCSAAAAGLQHSGFSFLWHSDDLLPSKHFCEWICHGTSIFFLN